MNCDALEHVATCTYIYYRSNRKERERESSVEKISRYLTYPVDMSITWQFQVNYKAGKWGP